MKITIDTKEDSHDEIKKVIFLLQNLLGHPDKNSIVDTTNLDMFQNKGESPGIFNMFDSAPEQNDEGSKEYKYPDESISESDEDEGDETPEIITYG